MVFLVMTFGVRLIQHRDLVTRLRNGEFENVEGVITNFEPGSFNGHRRERFTVAGRTYTFSSAEWRAGYHDVQGEGGPLADGIAVRIADVNGTIARFELLE
jgi:hypothetical protein